MKLSLLSFCICFGLGCLPIDVVADEPDDDSFDRISVVGSRDLTGSETDATQNLEYISSDELNTAPQKVSDLLDAVTGVGYNGQGGLWQAYSIRGVSRWRVQSLIQDIPILTERRAGNALSFIDPTLVDSVAVLKGPASTYYGSGALGGVINVMPTQFEGQKLIFDYNSVGNQHAISYLFGDESTQGGIAHRTSGNGEDASGNNLNDGFSQTSMVVNSSHEIDETRTLQFFFAPSIGKNIGKPNVEFPEKKVTQYPFEKHLIGSISYINRGDYAVKWYFHDQSWQSDVLRVGKRRNVVDYQSTDWGLNFQKNWQTSQVKGRWGIDTFTRKNVDVLERQYELNQQLSWSKANLSGEHHEYAIYADAQHEVDSHLLQAGARWSHYQQSAAGYQNTQMSKATGFFGYKFDFNQNWQLYAHIGNGFRFPSLTEKYFSGTTGRGLVVGNEQLKSETALNTEIGVHYSRNDWSLKLHYFNMDVDNYIERIEIGEGDDAYLTYRNVTSGNIHGVEGAVDWTLSDAFDLKFTWQLQQGENQQGESLADISPEKLSLNLNYHGEQWAFSADLSHRLAKEKFASGEVPLESVNIVNASATYQGFDDWVVKFYVANLSDAHYQNSADDLSNQSYGRNVGVTLTRSF